MKLIQRWKQTAIHNKALVFSGVVVAFGTVFYAMIAVVQVGLMNRADRQSSEQAAKVILEANRIATSMENSIRQNQTAIDKAAEANQRAIEASNAQNRKLVGATIAQSKAALQATIDSSRNDQRAWVGTEWAANPAISEGITIQYKIRVFNVGKTPALNYRSQAAAAITGTNEMPDFDKIPTPPFGSVSPLYQGVTNFAYAEPITFHAANIAALRIRIGVLSVFGKITYDDIFRCHHWTKFCYVYDGVGTFVDCNRYTEQDQPPYDCAQ